MKKILLLVLLLLAINVKAEEIEKLDPDMVFLSSGPGDPARSGGEDPVGAGAKAF